MVITMKPGATEEQIQAVCATIEEYGLETLLMPGSVMAIGIPSAIPADVREPLAQKLQILPGVSQVTHVSRSYKLASREFHPASTVVNVRGVHIGATDFVVMAGPCSIEGYEQLLEAAQGVRSAGALVLRGGAFKPRTSPYSFQGLAVEGLKIMRRVADEVGILTVSEVMSPDLVETVAEYVDILQIGARSMQNFPLLIEAGKSRKPVLLKRGPAATIDEFLLAAEYILSNGNPNVILCERGLVSFDRTYTRNLLDLAAVQVLKDHSHLPVIVDPSHGVGVAKYVPAMSCAALVAGADGLLVEVHPDPRRAMSDAAQTLDTATFAELMESLRRLGPFSKRSICEQAIAV